MRICRQAHFRAAPYRKRYIVVGIICNTDNTAMADIGNAGEHTYRTVQVFQKLPGPYGQTHEAEEIALSVKQL